MAEKDVVITFESLFELLRREKFRTELQKLDNDFFLSVIDYLKAKEAIVKSQENKKSIFSSEAEKTKNQLRNSKKMVKDVYERRETKILQNALLFARTKDNSLKINSMLPEEEALFEDITNMVTKHRKDILENVVNLKQPKKPKSLKGGNGCKKSNLVKFKSDVPAFVGPDLKNYGPFKKGDKTELPDDIKEMLIKNNQVKNESS